MKAASLFLLLALSLISFTEKKLPPSSKQINLLVQKEMNELHIPGMAVAVIQDGEVLHLGTYGIANIEWNQPVTKTTAFQIASVTKLFTSTLVMKYIQEGKIGLDDPITKFLPEAPPQLERDSCQTFAVSPVGHSLAGQHWRISGNKTKHYR
jgi:CubicO group peptidase (beta-lactamase class C family)